MRNGKKIKRYTQLIIISVIILTIVTLSVSYSAFFSVKSQSTVQEISTGTLDIVIDNSSAAMSTEELYPTPELDLPTSADSVIDGSYAALNLTNNGTLDADFQFTIGYYALPAGKKASDLISFNYLNVGIFDVKNNKWLDFGSNNFYIPISGLTPSEENIYPILRDQIDAGEARQYKVYIWLSEGTPISQIGKLVYLKLDVKSTTIEGHVDEGVGVE